MASKRLTQRMVPETIDSLSRAARQRLRDAEVLRRSNRRLAAIYLFGYSAEIRIKIGCYRVIGLGTDAPVESARRQAQSEIQTFDLDFRGAGAPSHSLLAWSQLLVHRHHRLGSPLDADLEADVLSHAQRLYSLWRESIRYQSTAVRGAELDEARHCALWFDRHALSL